MAKKKKREKPLIITVDDDTDCQFLIKKYLTAEGYEVVAINSALGAAEVIAEKKPDLILLDIIMPELNGYEVCGKLRASEENILTPVIFLTSLEEEQDKVKAFALGASDYLQKPIVKETLIERVQENLLINAKWQEVEKGTIPLNAVFTPSYFKRFGRFLCGQLGLAVEKVAEVEKIDIPDLYKLAPMLDVQERQLAQYIAAFIRSQYMQMINPEYIKLGVFSPVFCKNNLIIPLSEKNGKELAFVLSNPFSWELIDTLDEYSQGKLYKLYITEPQNILVFLKGVKSGRSKEDVKFDLDVKQETGTVVFGPTTDAASAERLLKRYPINFIANKLMHKAVVERASDIHIEPKEDKSIIRFRIDGNLMDIAGTEKQTGIMLLNHFKVAAGLNVAEKVVPQDGSVDVVVDEKTFRLRMATTSTSNGESIVIRLLEPDAKTKALDELGLTKVQIDKMVKLGKHPKGLIIVVGPTGSGKSTTIYSLLSTVNSKERSLLSIEDPVEYKIKYANQQQVNPKRGVTFTSLLKAAVRQDPDILYLGEIRDDYSAKTSLDFASTGHLTITSLHTDNSVSAFYRLERLGVSRGAMAESIIAVVAQRLIRKPCLYCRQIVPIPEEEAALLRPFTDDIPEKVLHPVGCLKCNNTGYLGREGVYEILSVTPEIAQMIRGGDHIQKIREFLHSRGDVLISGQAIDKIRSQTFAVNDVYQSVLLEEEEHIKSIRKGVFVPMDASDKFSKKKATSLEAEPTEAIVEPTTTSAVKPAVIPDAQQTVPQKTEAAIPVEPIVESVPTPPPAAAPEAIPVTSVPETQQSTPSQKIVPPLETVIESIPTPAAAATPVAPASVPQQSLPLTAPATAVPEPQPVIPSPAITPVAPVATPVPPASQQPAPSAVPVATPIPATPVAPVTPSPVPQQPVAPQVPTGSKKSILVIDDDKDIIMLLKHHLEQSYAVDVAEDGAKALLCIGKNKYDLIVSDIAMPNLDGYQLLEIMKQQKIEVPVIYLTANITAEQEIKGFNMGAVDYVKKPVAFGVLGVRIQRILDK